MRPTAAEAEWRYRYPAMLCALLAALTLHASRASDLAAAGGGSARADTISLAGAVEHPRTLTLADLKRAPATTQIVSLKTGKGVLKGSFTGVLLWTLLQQAVIKVSDGKNDVMRHTIVVTSSDGYATVLSAGELDPQFGGEQALIAYAKDGQPLADKRGFARLILPADKEAARAISGVASITVQ